MIVSLDKILFCSAIAIELGDLQDFVPHSKDLGVGNLEASIQLSRILQTNPNIQEIVFIGSAGTYDPSKLFFPSYAIGRNYYYREISVWKKESYAPDLLPQFIQTESSDFGVKIVKSNNNFAIADVNSPNSITLIDPQSLPIWVETPMIENMEAFGIARVCQIMKKKFTSVFAITNAVGRDGSQEWNKNHKSMAEELIQIIKRFI
ncbi:hypothetical protein [Leptospira sp. GIMC2001]|uniref:hypothetical protein n=1 Tax=Leptospira sp. GIMC2001 TaxID=1513297 RepID=UPI0023493D93|nr:hypothetical protein [Leptospira sp. GIMC2001]WCL50968.1 hypothetical protein O4O04_09195 [Leptospira sp. GIMC2001]